MRHRKIQVDFQKLEKQSYKSLNKLGKEIVDNLVEISTGSRDSLGRRKPTSLTITQKAILDLIRESFYELTKKQKEVLTLVYGLNGEQPHTERDIAVQLGISHQGVNKLKQRAIKAIRSKVRINQAALKKIAEKP